MAVESRTRELLCGSVPLLVNLLGVGGTYRLLERLVRVRDEAFIEHVHKESLRRFFPDRDDAWLDRVVRKLGRHNMWSYLDSLILPALPEASIDQIFWVDGLKAIDRALSRGKGVILYGIHYGRIWTGIIYVCKKGYRLSTIVSLRGLGAALNVERCLTGELIDAEAFSKEKVYERLRNNEIVLTMADGGVARRPVRARFLGRSAYLSPSFIRFARETGAALISWIGVSRTRDRIELHFKEANGYQAETSFGRQMEVLLAPLAEYVKDDPSQWYSSRRILGER